MPETVLTNTTTIFTPLTQEDLNAFINASPPRVQSAAPPDDHPGPPYPKELKGVTLYNWVVEKIRVSAPKTCPKCSKFVQTLVDWADNRSPGYYCNAAGCGWFKEAEVPFPKLHQIDKILTPNVLELIKLVPNNPVVRSLVHQACGKAVPVQMDTFDKISDWASRAVPPNILCAAGAPSMFKQFPGIAVCFTRRVSGSMPFTTDEQCVVTFPVGPEQMLRWCREKALQGINLNYIHHYARELFQDFTLPDGVQWSAVATETDSDARVIENSSMLSTQLRSNAQFVDSIKNWLYYTDTICYQTMYHNRGR